MPEVIKLADGTEKEVLTADELKALQDKAASAESLQAEHARLKQELESKAPESQDWRLARRKIDKMEEQLKQQGKHVNEHGEITDAPKQVNPDEIVQKATEAARKEANAVALNRYEEEQLSSFNEEDRKVVKHYYDKLSAGEERTYESIRKHISEAAAFAKPQGSNFRRIPLSGNGAPPRYDVDANGRQAGQSFADTSDGEAVAREIWGDKAYSNKKQ